MSVPNNNIFSLQDVVDEVNPTTDDLLDCVSDAVAASYDTNYYTAPATSMLEFRNYSSVVSLTSFVIDNSFAYGSAQSACSLGSGTTLRTLYHDGSGTYPAIGDIIYQDSAGQFPYGTANWYYIPSLDGWIQINDDNEVVDTGICLN